MAFEEILEDYKAVQSQTPIRRTDCPVCDSTLEEARGTLHCRTCGWTEDGQVWRDAA
jgi:hypothetical protein